MTLSSMSADPLNKLKHPGLHRTHPSICSAAFCSQWPMAYSKIWYQTRAPGSKHKLVHHANVNLQCGVVWRNIHFLLSSIRFYAQSLIIMLAFETTSRVIVWGSLWFKTLILQCGCCRLGNSEHILTSGSKVVPYTSDSKSAVGVGQMVSALYIYKKNNGKLQSIKLSNKKTACES